MNRELTTRPELNFLREQMNAIDHKIAYLESALETCEDPLEANGLRAMLNTTRLERDVLDELILRQVDAGASSLEAVILDAEQRLRRAAEGRVSSWRHGHATPSSYWDYETRQAFLSELLSRYHAWQDGRPHHPPANGKRTSAEATTPGFALPWYPFNAPEEEPLAERLPVTPPPTRDELFQMLEGVGVHPDHLRLVVEADGLVLATGFLHSEAEREQCEAALAAVEGVRELLTGIVVVEEAHCPLCQGRHPDRREPEDGNPQRPAES
ncbi:MAG: hypothetical protein Kow00106_11270 [Anaerolineae bacterium]